MNCETIIANLGFECQALGDEVLRVWSPFTYGEDGELIGLYVEQLHDGYRVTDNAESLMHASMMGVRLSDKRFTALRRASHGVDISDGGVISAMANRDSLKDAVASVLNASLAIGHFETLWKPRVRSETFNKVVGDLLEAELGDKVKREVGVLGASGHQIELPIAIVTPTMTTFIQPIAASSDDTVDWNNVYSGFGKMMDLKSAGANRVTVLEDAANDDELPRAQTLLAMSSTVVKFSKLREWAKRHAA